MAISRRTTVSRKPVEFESILEQLHQEIGESYHRATFSNDRVNFGNLNKILTPMTKATQARFDEPVGGGGNKKPLTPGGSPELKRLVEQSSSSADPFVAALTNSTSNTSPTGAPSTAGSSNSTSSTVVTSMEGVSALPTFDQPTYSDIGFASSEDSVHSPFSKAAGAISAAQGIARKAARDTSGNTQLRLKASSTIQAAAYWPPRQSLVVSFKSGGSYLYTDVPVEVILSWEKAGSAGSFFYYNIRMSFGYQKLG